MASTVETPVRLDSAAPDMYQLISDLYPICRSITGDGLRRTLRMIQTHIPLTIHEVASGTRVFDWTVPKEWNIRDAYIKNFEGRRIVDFRASNLHVVSYSVPVHRRMSLEELKSHLFTLPEHPDWIPYRTSYYNETWGFCLTHNQTRTLQDDEYEVLIDSSLEDGSLTYGEMYLKGQTSDEVLVSTHACHPSLCNDNLSGVAVATFLAKQLATHPPGRYSYRFLFIPGTIGSITWLCQNEARLASIKHGLVLSCLGDSGAFTYKRSRRGYAEIDRAAANVLRHSDPDQTVVDFSPYGYDERQYCSPAFDLPVGCLSRTPHGRFPEYHSSADNLAFIRQERLGEALAVALKIVHVLEHNTRCLNLMPKCEPHLGKRGLYRLIGGFADPDLIQQAMLWVLNLSDGAHSLLDISDRSGIAFDVVHRAASSLAEHGLLQANERGVVT